VNAADCPMCDDGYKSNGTVCDHVDRTRTVRRGMLMVQAVLKDHQPRRVTVGGVPKLPKYPPPQPPPCPDCGSRELPCPCEEVASGG